MKDELPASVQRSLARCDRCAICSTSPQPPHHPAGGQTITAYASGQVALDLRALPRGATICVTLHDVPHGLQIIAFTFSPA